MTEDSIEQSAGFLLLGAERWGSKAVTQDRNFWIALGVAALLHASLLLSISKHVPRQLGEADGAQDAISVSVVTEADLQSKSTVPEKAEAPPAQPVQTAPPPAAPAPEPPPEAKPEPKTEPQAELAPSITEDVPDILDIPEPGQAPQKKTPPPPKPQPQQQKPQAQPNRTAKLDLSPPKPSFSAPSSAGGRSAGFERPPGITRSGANDDFARGVIRALQQTMPQLRETLGRVTVRITLNQNGNVVDVEVMRPSPRSDLNQSVVFAAKQTSYPFPPPNSTPADRTFLVTYIYN